jgi:hypothetical protein
VIVKLDFTDGTTETVRIPAEVWRRNSERATWQYVTPKTLRRAEVDPSGRRPTPTAATTPSRDADARHASGLGPGHARPGDRIRDNDLKISPTACRPCPPRPGRPDRARARHDGRPAVAPPPGDAPAVPRGEPGVPPSNPPPGSAEPAATPPAGTPR